MRAVCLGVLLLAIGCVTGKTRNLCAPDCKGSDCLAPNAPACLEVSGTDAGTSDSAVTDGAMDAATDAVAEDTSDAGCLAHKQCAAPTPACGPNGVCVECTTAQPMACTGDKAVCDEGTNTCIGCQLKEDCTNPSASVCNMATRSCEACTADADCAHLAGTPVCDVAAQKCVPCVPGKLAACGGKVCDVVGSERKCTSFDVGSAVACGDCVSDQQCGAGLACVKVAAGAGRFVCMPVQNSGCPRPYINALDKKLTSADGALVPICSFRVETTTCLAAQDYQKRCGSEDPANKTHDLDGTADDSKCGEPGMNDGYCVWQNGVQQYWCTVACIDSILDCPVRVQECVKETGLCKI